MKKNTLVIIIAVCVALSGAIVYAATSPTQNGDSPFKKRTEKKYIPPVINAIVPVKIGASVADQGILVKHLNAAFPKKASEIFNIVKNSGGDIAKLNAGLATFDKTANSTEIRLVLTKAVQATREKVKRIKDIDDAKIAEINRQEELKRIAAEKLEAEKRIAEEQARLAEIARIAEEKRVADEKAESDFKKSLTTEELKQFEDFKKEMADKEKADAYKQWYQEKQQQSSDHGTTDASSDHSTSVFEKISTPIVDFFKKIFSW